MRRQAAQCEIVGSTDPQTETRVRPTRAHPVLHKDVNHRIPLHIGHYHFLQRHPSGLRCPGWPRKAILSALRFLPQSPSACRHPRYRACGKHRLSLRPVLLLRCPDDPFFRERFVRPSHDRNGLYQNLEERGVQVMIYDSTTDRRNLACDAYGQISTIGSIFALAAQGLSKTENKRVN